MFNNNVLSIDIGSKNTKILVGRHQKNNIFVERALRFSTPSDCIQDGKISDSGKLSMEIERVLKDEKIKVKDTICTIQSTQIITREIILPSVKPEEIDTMIKYEIEQYLPIMLSEYIVQYKLLQEFEEDGVKKMKLLVAALHKEIVEGYMELIKRTKLNPIALDINYNSVSKLFDTRRKHINDKEYDLSSTIAIIDIGFKSINLNIISNGRPKFNRLLVQGGNDIDINIANSFNLTLEEAEAKKLDCSIEPDNRTSSNNIIGDIVKTNIDAFIQDIQRMFQYYKSRSSENRIEQIFLAGGSSKIVGLSQYIEEMLGIPTERINKLSNIKLSKSLIELDFDYYINSVGSIIRR